MAMKKKPVTGMKDITPREMEIRDYVIRMIKDTYGTFGFSSIETPCVEHIENLSSKQGGENEKLIFKILKRGEKLKIDTAETEMDLVDCSAVQILCKQCKQSAKSVQSTADGKCMACRQTAERPLPPVHAV